jgi:hypothetical protein
LHAEHLLAPTMPMQSADFKPKNARTPIAANALPLLFLFFQILVNRFG